jgi:hypothetical protein
MPHYNARNLGITTPLGDARLLIERMSVGFQMVTSRCERRTLPKSTTRADETGQGLLHFYRPPSLHEKLASRANAPLHPSRGQKTDRPVGYLISVKKPFLSHPMEEIEPGT